MILIFRYSLAHFLRHCVRRKNMLPLPETPGVVTGCPSFAVAHFSFGCTKQRELFRDLFAHETLLAWSKRRTAEHNYTLKHKIRYSGKKLSYCFLLNSFTRIDTHGEIVFIQLGYTCTGSLLYLTIIVCHRRYTVARVGGRGRGLR
jgi:hypothetical protein